MRLPLLMPAPSELERAGDPQVACVEADDLVAGVKDAPVARPCTPERDRFDVTSWCYTIRAGVTVSTSHLSIAKARVRHSRFGPRQPTPAKPASAAIA
jgi:hypothetical protein